MEQMVERENMISAYKKVVDNKGSAGVDNMTVDQLKPYLQTHWAEIKSAFLNGRYKPQPVLQVLISKPNGGQRALGIPTVVDRLIQQAIYQVLNPIFEPGFSIYSYGFQKGKSAHDAINQAREFQAKGRRWVVDMDLEKFFDEVNHDILMSKIAKKIKDKRMLKLLRIYLGTGIMIEGMTTLREKGTPQGSPLSPLLSNIILDELDKEIENRGHAFCRYADDCNIYVSSKRAGERVLKSIARFMHRRLKLKVNWEKSAVDRPWRRTFLGYSYTWHKSPKIRLPRRTIQRFRRKAKQLFRKGRGRNLGRFIEEDLNPLIRGWINYFHLSEIKGFAEELDSWIRRRLRLIIWRQWKRPGTRKKRFLERGFTEERASKSAYNGRGAWWNSGSSHMNTVHRKKYFDKLGLVSMLNFVN
ncbi:group II intron reverse transcriptase/maturase [bacterium]|nr:group II intron reverse transcriptase/maturase [bacterium]